MGIGEKDQNKKILKFTVQTKLVRVITDK